MIFKQITFVFISLATVSAIFKTDDGLTESDENILHHEEKVRRFFESFPEEMHSCLYSCFDLCPRESKRQDIGLNCMVPCINKCSPLTGEDSPEFERDKKLKALLESLPKNYCVNGYNPQTTPAKLLLMEFAKGPCSPLMLVPGVTATRLVVNINCEELMVHEQKTFEQCGWNACSKQSYEFWKNVPDPEYALWIPSVMSPLSIFTLSEKSNLCFASLIKPHYKLDKPVNEMFEPRKGIKITFTGFSSRTKQESMCGGNAIQNLLPISVQTNESLGFAPLLHALEYIGYTNGLTMQALPYNFYYSYRNNEFIINFSKNLERLNTLTGKKVTIVAHSMGNINVLYNLKKMSQEEKKKRIFNWLSIGAPFLGSPKSQKTLISGSDEYISLNGYFGFHFKAFILTTSNQMSLYELAAYDPFKIYEGQRCLRNNK